MSDSKSIRNRYKQLKLNKRLNDSNSNNNNLFKTSINKFENDKILRNSSMIRNESHAFENSQNLINKEKSNLVKGINNEIKEKTKPVLKIKISTVNSNNNNSFNASINKMNNIKRPLNRFIININPQTFENVQNKEKVNLIKNNDNKIIEKIKAEPKIRMNTSKKINNSNIISKFSHHILPQKFRKRDKENFQKKFNELKSKKDITLKDLDELMDDDNTNADYIQFYLDKIRKNYSEILNKKLSLLYFVLPKEICLNYNVQKKKLFNY